MTAIITLKQLTDARACSEQVALFEATFGDSVNVTVAKARKVAGKFDWYFAVRFLDDEGSAAYKAAMAPAYAAYEAAMAPADAAYEAAMAPADAAYKAAMAAADAAYKAAMAPADAAYEAARAPADAAYKAARAPAAAAYKAARAPAWASAYIATCKRAKVAA